MSKETTSEKLIKKIPINKIITEAGTQMRIELNEETVEEYAEDMRNGDEFPHLVVFYGNNKYYLADGFHRLEAASQAKKRSINCEIKQGRLRDAKLYAAGANTRHGLKRTREDKRQSVEILLKDKEWCGWSNREIGRHCKVDHKTVGKIRRELTGEIPSEKTYKTKHGTIAKMNTLNIGKSSKRVGESKKLTGEFPSEKLKLSRVTKNKLKKYTQESGLKEDEIIEKALKLFFKKN